MANGALREGGDEARRRPDGSPGALPGNRVPLGQWLPPLGAAALLATAAIAAALSSTEVTQVPLPRQAQSGRAGAATPSLAAPSASSFDAQRRAPFTIAVPGWVTTAIGALCLIAIGSIVALMIWYVIRNTIEVQRAPRPADAGEPDRLTARPEEVIAAVDAGLSDLADLGGNARSAVIACWVRLEEAAAAAGTPRQIGDTSTDLVIRLLHAHQVSRPVLDSFAAVYRQARYSTGPVDERMRVTAVNALTQLRTELSAYLPVEPVTAGAQTAGARSGAETAGAEASPHPPELEIRPARPESGR